MVEENNLNNIPGEGQEGTSSPEEIKTSLEEAKEESQQAAAKRSFEFKVSMLPSSFKRTSPLTGQTMPNALGIQTLISNVPLSFSRENSNSDLNALTLNIESAMNNESVKKVSDNIDNKYSEDIALLATPNYNFYNIAENASFVSENIQRLRSKNALERNSAIVNLMTPGTSSVPYSFGYETITNEDGTTSEKLVFYDNIDIALKGGARTEGALRFGTFDPSYEASGFTPFMPMPSVFSPSGRQRTRSTINQRFIEANAGNLYGAGAKYREGFKSFDDVYSESGESMYTFSQDGEFFTPAGYNAYGQTFLSPTLINNIDQIQAQNDRIFNSEQLSNIEKSSLNVFNTADNTSTPVQTFNLKNASNLIQDGGWTDESGGEGKLYSLDFMSFRNNVILKDLADENSKNKEVDWYGENVIEFEGIRGGQAMDDIGQGLAFGALQSGLNEETIVFLNPEAGTLQFVNKTDEFNEQASATALRQGLAQGLLYDYATEGLTDEELEEYYKSTNFIMETAQFLPFMGINSSELTPLLNFYETGEWDESQYGLIDTYKRGITEKIDALKSSVDPSIVDPMDMIRQTSASAPDYYFDVMGQEMIASIKANGGEVSDELYQRTLFNGRTNLTSEESQDIMDARMELYGKFFDSKVDWRNIADTMPSFINYLDEASSLFLAGPTGGTIPLLKFITGASRKRKQRRILAASKDLENEVLKRLVATHYLSTLVNVTESSPAMFGGQYETIDGVVYDEVQREILINAQRQLAQIEIFMHEAITNPEIAEQMLVDADYTQYPEIEETLEEVTRQVRGAQMMAEMDRLGLPGSGAITPRGAFGEFAVFDATAELTNAVVSNLVTIPTSFGNFRYDERELQLSQEFEEAGLSLGYGLDITNKSDFERYETTDANGKIVDVYRNTGSGTTYVSVEGGKPFMLRSTFVPTVFGEGSFVGAYAPLESRIGYYATNIMGSVIGFGAISKTLKGLGAATSFFNNSKYVLSPATKLYLNMAGSNFLMGSSNLNPNKAFGSELLKLGGYSMLLAFAQGRLNTIEARQAAGTLFKGTRATRGVDRVKARIKSGLSEYIEEYGAEGAAQDIATGLVSLATKEKFESQFIQNIRSTFSDPDGQAQALLTLGMGYVTGQGPGDMSNATINLISADPIAYKEIVETLTNAGLLDLEKRNASVANSQYVYNAMQQYVGMGNISKDALPELISLHIKKTLLGEGKLGESAQQEVAEEISIIEQRERELLEINRNQQSLNDKGVAFVINGVEASKEEVMEILERPGGYNGELIDINDMSEVDLINSLYEQKDRYAQIGVGKKNLGDLNAFRDEATSLDYKTRPSQSTYDALNTQALAALESLTKVYPDLDIIVHDNQGDFFSATGSRGRGAFDSENSVIHINAAKADSTTVPHEVFEAFISLGASKNQGIRNEMIDLANEVMENVDEATRAQLETFVSMYSEGEASKETLAQFFGILSNNSSPEVQEKARGFFSNIGSMFGVSNKSVQGDGVISLMENLAGKVKTGEQITEAEIIPISGETQTQAMAAQEGDLGAQKDLDISESEYNIRRALDNANRQQDGSYVFNEVPPEGLDYTVKRSGPLRLGKRQYIVSGENFDAFRRESLEKSERAKAGFEAKMEYLNKGIDGINVNQVEAILESLIRQNDPQSAEQIYKEAIEKNKLDPSVATDLLTQINDAYEAMGSSQRVSVEATTEEGAPVTEEDVSVTANEKVDNITEKIRAGEDVTYEEYKEAITLSDPETAVELYKQYVNKNDQVDADLVATINESLEQMNSPMRIDQYGVQTNIEAEADLQAQEEMKAAVDARVEELEASIDGTNSEAELVAESDPEAPIERIQEEVKGVIDKTKERWNEEKAMETTLEEQQYENALAYARGTKAYQEGDSETRGQIIDMVKNEMGVSLTETQGRPEKMTGTEMVVDSYEQMKRELELQEKAGKLAVGEQQKAERDMIAKINEQFKENGIFLTPAQSKRIYDLVARTDMTNAEARARVEMETAKIVNQNKGKVLVDQFRALREQYKAEERADRRGRMAQRNATATAGLDAIEMLKEAGVTLSNAQTRSLLRILSNTDFNNEVQAARAEQKIDKMISDKKFKQEMSDLKKDASKAKANIKKLGADAEAAGTLSSLLDVNPLDISTEEVTPTFDENGDVSSGQLIPGEKVKYNMSPFLSAEATVIMQDKDGVAIRLEDGTEVNVSRDDISYTYLDRYKSIVDAMSQRGKEISLPDRAMMMRQAESIFNNVTEGEIAISDAVAKEGMSEAERQKISDESYNSFSASIDPDTETQVLENIPNKDSRSVASEIFKITEEEFKSLDLKDQVLLSNVIDNINNGFVSNNAFNVLQKVKANRTSDMLLEKTSGSLLSNLAAPIGTIRAGIYSLFGGRKFYNQALRLNVETAIDRIMGNINDSSIYNATLGKLKSANEQYEVTRKMIQSKLTKASNLLSKGYKKDEARNRRAEIKALELQREWESNPDKRGSKVFTAIEWLDYKIANTQSEAEIKRLNAVKNEMISVFGMEYINGKLSDENISEQERAKLQEQKDALIEKFGSEEAASNVSFEDGYNALDLDQNFKDAFDIITEVNQEFAEQAMTASSLYRPGSAEAYYNYTRHSVEGEQEGIDPANRFSADRMSTRGTTTYGRSTGLKAIDFDAVTTAYNAASSTMLDYYMTPAVKEVRMGIEAAMENIRQEYDNDISRYSKDEKYIKLEGLYTTIEEANDIVLARNEVGTSNRIGTFLLSTQAGAKLAKATRFIAEGASNLIHAVTKTPRAGFLGLEFMARHGIINLPGTEGKAMTTKFLANVGSTEVQRLTSDADLAIATGGDITDKTLSLKDRERLGRIYETSGAEQVVEAGKEKIKKVMSLSDWAMSKPDRAVGLPIWFGSFAQQWKKVTGRDFTNEDFQKIINNDEAFLRENSDAVRRATQFADKRSMAQSATVTRGYGGKLSFKRGKRDSGLVAAGRRVNAYMRNFMSYEYENMVQGALAMVKSGEMTKMEGAGAIAGGAARMYVYQALLTGLKRMVFGDEEEENVKNAKIITNPDGSESYAFENYDDIPEDLRELGEPLQGALGFYVEKEKVDAWMESQEDIFGQQGRRGLGQYVLQAITGGGGGLESQAINFLIDQTLMDDEAIAAVFNTYDPETQTYNQFENSVGYSKLSDAFDEYNEGGQVDIEELLFALFTPHIDPLASRTQRYFDIKSKKNSIENRLDEDALLDDSDPNKMTDKKREELEAEVQSLKQDAAEFFAYTITNAFVSAPVLNDIINQKLSEITDDFYESEAKPPEIVVDEEPEVILDAFSKNRANQMLEDYGTDNRFKAINDLIHNSKSSRGDGNIAQEIIKYEFQGAEAWLNEYDKKRIEAGSLDDVNDDLVYGKYLADDMTIRQVRVQIYNNLPDGPEKDYFRKLIFN